MVTGNALLDAQATEHLVDLAAAAVTALYLSIARSSIPGEGRLAGLNRHRLLLTFN